jgi:hypothetical protein
MKFLNSRRAWVRWTVKNMLGEWKEPDEYPCYAYLIKERPEYLYADDVGIMAVNMGFNLEDYSPTLTSFANTQ